MKTLIALAALVTLATGIAPAGEADPGQARVLLGIAHDELLLARNSADDPERARELYRSALERTREAYELDSPHPAIAAKYLGQLAERALLAGFADDARRYAEQALVAVTHARQEPPVVEASLSGATHHANLVLGKLALEAGDVAGAEEHLLAAARHDGSPRLNSFGPNMELARRLLEAGRREAVLEYFELCRGFWTLGREHGTLDRWVHVVVNGGIPDFRANLIYGM